MLNKIAITILIIITLFVTANTLTKDVEPLTPPRQPPAHDNIREAIWCFDYFFYKIDEYGR